MIDPWGSNQYFDYDKLINEFGIEKTDDFFDFYLFRRHLIFGQRGMDYIKYSINNHKKFNAMTGLMPSGHMHLGNKLTIDQILYFQSIGADVTIAVADLESYTARGIPFKKARDIAINEYLVNYISMGLKPCKIYFQSESYETQNLAYVLSNKTNISELKAIYGFQDSSPILHLVAPIIQAADVLHTQLSQNGGPRATVVPVGVDQDPHIRLMRDLARKLRIYGIKLEEKNLGIYIRGTEKPNEYIDAAKSALSGYGYDIDINYEYRAMYIKNAASRAVEIDFILSKIEQEFNDFTFIEPAATFQKLETGLKGGKMSSSVPDSLIGLNDDSIEAKNKIKHAVTGGRQTVEEQRKYGGNPDICPVFELYNYHVSDDKHVMEVYNDCKNGKRMCGECKAEAGENIAKFLESLKEKRDESISKIDNYLIKRSF